MRKLIKYDLDFNRTLEYIDDNLKNINVLSSVVLNFVDFTKGYFYTLLPEDSNIEKLYEFNKGWIVPQDTEKKYIVDGKIATYAEITTVREEVSAFLLHKTKIHESSSLLFDDVIRRVNDKNHLGLFHSHGLAHENEIYYLLKESEITQDLISECLKASNAFWHSLCILTSTNLKNIRELDLEKIKNICLQSRLIVIGAYDSEGYIFWEKKPLEK